MQLLVPPVILALIYMATTVVAQQPPGSNSDCPHPPVLVLGRSTYCEISDYKVSTTNLPTQIIVEGGVTTTLTGTEVFTGFPGDTFTSDAFPSDIFPSGVFPSGVFPGISRSTITNAVTSTTSNAATATNSVTAATTAASGDAVPVMARYEGMGLGVFAAAAVLIL